jgi:hypothetical protein
MQGMCTLPGLRMQSRSSSYQDHGLKANLKTEALIDLLLDVNAYVSSLYAVLTAYAQISAPFQGSRHRPGLQAAQARGPGPARSLWLFTKSIPNPSIHQLYTSKVV